MKKVFSKEKFIEDRRSDGLSEEDIQKHLNRWANKCEGLTLEEMLSRGCYADHDWLIEVPDDEELIYEKLKEENEELKLELNSYRQAILQDKEMLGLKEQNQKYKEVIDKVIDLLDNHQNNLYSKQARETLDDDIEIALKILKEVE